MKKVLLHCAALLAALVCVHTAFAQNVGQGSLEATNETGKSLGACPLKRTDVKAEISGFLSRVRVRQEFENNFAEKIEAVYIFPLPNNAAVDDMTMHVGARTIKGKILPREEARQVYEDAKNNGQTASLLDQERPNVFTQSVANILPGERITIEIAYVETLKYEDGAYEFVFPTVVAPRYNPAGVADAGKITPKLAPKAMRAGHDISIEISLDAGVPIESVTAKSHQIEITTIAANRANVKLKTANEIPNRDFVLRYDVSGKQIADAILTNRTERGGFFTMILQPPNRVQAADVMPKEIVFVLDTSGSMEGFPLDKAKESMRLALDNLYPGDTFNLITFAGDTAILFDQPVPATAANLAKARRFLNDRKGGGGTEMMTAIKAALEPSNAQNHVRLVCFMTDGHVGNEAEIISEVQKHPNARVFSFGIGESVNRYLLDKLAEQGRGAVEYVGLNDDGSAAAKRFHERIRNPILTDVEIDWNGLPVADVYPKRQPDLFAAKPVVIYGRYTKGATGTIRLRGKMRGQEFVREIAVNLPEQESAHDTLAALWARSRIEELTMQDPEGLRARTADPNLQNQIAGLGLEFRLLTEFTSFVAVEEFVVTEGGQPRRIDVPVETPAGVKRENIATDEISSLPINGRSVTNYAMLSSSAQVSVSSSRKMSKPRISGGRRSGSVTANKSNTPVQISGVTLTPGKPVPSPQPVASAEVPAVVSGGVVNGKASVLTKPAFPPAAKAVRAGGAVSVQVTIDENGNVISANATSGHPLLRAAAANAAKQSKFAATQISGQPIKTTGVIVYNFNEADAQVEIPNHCANPPCDNLSLADLETAQTEGAKRRRLLAKLHPAIFAVIEPAANNQSDAVQFKTDFIKNGTAEIRILLLKKDAAVVEELRKLQVEIVLNPENGKFVVGRIALDKLAALVELENVVYIAPQQ